MPRSSCSAGRRTDRFGPLLAVGLSWASFVVGLVVIVQLRRPRRRRPGHAADHVDWIPAGSFQLDAGLLVDPLSMAFVMLITFVGSLIHVYSLGYMEHDPDKRRFFAYLNLFVAAMLAARPRRLLPAALRRLGGRGSGLVPAHRLLELQPGVRDRGQQGVRRQPRR